MAPTTIDEASLKQMQVLTIFPKFSSALSILGSLYVAVDIMKQPKRKLYHRLVFGMSVCDVLSSLAFFCTTWPIPPDVLPMWGAAGTVQTCEAQGFFTQFSLSTPFYNGALAVYYLCVLRLGWSERKAQKLEIALHSVPILAGLGTSTASLSMGLLNPTGWDCWINAVPIGCQESWLNGGKTTCIRGDNANLFQWIFFFIPLWIMIFGVTIVMIFIFVHYYQQEKKTQKWQQNYLRDSIVKRKERKKSKIREMAVQCILYTLSFYVTWIFPTLLRIHGVIVEKVWYRQIMLSAAFLPLQGFWNFLVYLRPRFKKLREARRAQRERQQGSWQQQQSQPQQQKPGKVETDINHLTSQTAVVTFENNYQNSSEIEPKQPTELLERNTRKNVFPAPLEAIRQFLSDVKDAVVQGDGGLGGVDAAQTSIDLRSRVVSLNENIQNSNVYHEDPCDAIDNNTNDVMDTTHIGNQTRSNDQELHSFNLISTGPTSSIPALHMIDDDDSRLGGLEDELTLSQRQEFQNERGN